jgi:hypothetical protein
MARTSIVLGMNNLELKRGLYLIYPPETIGGVPKYDDYPDPRTL